MRIRNDRPTTYISLTIADIGLDEKNIEEQLVKWFTLAEEWHAILLIDEAGHLLGKDGKGITSQEMDLSLVCISEFHKESFSNPSLVFLRKNGIFSRLTLSNN
jgi:hypothetical protein